MGDDRDKRKTYAVVGPTAVGKTAFAVELALRCGGEVVSADSMQVYRGLDRGTAKPSREEMRGVPHHMIDVADPRENYSVAAFAEAARRAIDGIFARGRTPVICGGSGLYVNALLYEMDFSFVDSATPLRSAQNDKGENGSVGADLTGGGDAGALSLHRQLIRRDPLAAWVIHPNNEKRIRRALERLDGGEGAEGAEGTAAIAGPTDAPRLRAFSESFTPTAQFSPEIFRLTAQRSELYRRIDARVDAFLANGLVEEVADLLAAGVPRGSTAMQGIGYKEIAAHLAGECTLEDAMLQIKYATHHLAKRQETWFRRLSQSDFCHTITV
ncbi:MAG: tRNA (adenosine(37)-N6)-dimethylallyltransferase MiaA [Clostridiales Family XIII bacterium]|jgi:tRNA dimethylallyltransferase|nr:tRNA (adenosine(37)-N6)-dimethylallyltransferase MiaA [Clostridiales Family XIII bacterium]